MTPERLFTAVGAVSGFLGVAAGAFGAHALRNRLSTDLAAVFETGARYQLYHALALLGVAALLSRWTSAQLVWAGWLFIVGTVIFSGSLYTLALSGVRAWGAITPVGGLCFLAGWLLVAWGALGGTG